MVESLRVPSVSGDPISARLRILSLTGGGYRGLFTAAVVAKLEQRIAPARLCDRFDVFAGTSIGGLLACGLAIGVPAATLLSTLKEHGPKVFAPKTALGIRRLFATPYTAQPLAEAIRACLGVWADKPISDVERGLLVTAINWVEGAPVVFRNQALGAAGASRETLLDVCLATAAAPTFFPPHVIGKAPMIDGGLIANNPDCIALIETLKRWPEAMPRISIRTYP